MEFRTTFNIKPSEKKITFRDPVIFIGSCFAAGIGKKLDEGHLPVMINPSGTVYNPVSVCNTLDDITGGHDYDIKDLCNNNGIWISLNHYTDFSSPDPDALIDKINGRIKEAGRFFKTAGFIFFTFGTARVFRWKRSGKIVSNCHKIPASEFVNELLKVDDIVSLWSDRLDKLQSMFPDLKVVFTISPVRHWKDGAHGNNVSKSVLFLAVEELLAHPSHPEYFPAYELLMDDLRDYRFYDDDMLHPSGAAIDYIWDIFSGCYINEKTMELWHEVEKITKAVSHRLRTGSADDIRKFAKVMLNRIRTIEDKASEIDLTSEKQHFRDLLKNQ